MEGQLAHLHLGFKTEIPWNVHQRFPPQNTSAHCDWTSHPQNLLKNQNHWQWRLSGKTWRKSLTVYSEKRVITRHITRHNMSAGAQWRDLWRLRCRRGHRHRDLRGFQQLLSQLNEPQSTQLDMVSSNHQVLDVYWCLLMFIDVYWLWIGDSLWYVCVLWWYRNDLFSTTTTKEDAQLRHWRLFSRGTCSDTWAKGAAAATPWLWKDNGYIRGNISHTVV